LAALAVLASCGLGRGADPPPAKKDLPKPLPKEIVAAWKKAGAQVGWMRVEESGSIRFLPEEKGVAGDLPALRFSPWKRGVSGTLPAPAAAFGLDLSRTEVTDAGLNALAGFQSLQALNLGATEVTDAGLKALAGLKRLQTLRLFFTNVTDEGL